MNKSNSGSFVPNGGHSLFDGKTIGDGSSVIATLSELSKNESKGEIGIGPMSPEEGKKGVSIGYDYFCVDR